MTELNAELEQVAYIASHDLKAPLTTLDGLLSCVMEDLESGDLESVQLNLERSLDVESSTEGTVFRVVFPALDRAQAASGSDQVESVS